MHRRRAEAGISIFFFFYSRRYCRRRVLHLENRSYFKLRLKSFHRKQTLLREKIIDTAIRQLRITCSIVINCYILYRTKIPIVAIKETAFVVGLDQIRWYLSLPRNRRDIGIISLKRPRRDSPAIHNVFPGRDTRATSPSRRSGRTN